MKSPDEIKKGLECCMQSCFELKCDECTYDEFSGNAANCIAFMTGDAYTYIAHLEQLIAQVKRERDAAVRDIANYAHSGNICKHCHNDCKHSDLGCPLWPSDCEDYEWRGVCEENTKDDAGV